MLLLGTPGMRPGPRLHFQLSDANSELGTEGFPVRSPIETPTKSVAEMNGTVISCRLGRK
jgi:hypothetical protein